MRLGLKTVAFEVVCDAWDFVAHVQMATRLGENGSVLFHGVLVEASNCQIDEFAGLATVKQVTPAVIAEAAVLARGGLVGSEC